MRKYEKRINLIDEYMNKTNLAREISDYYAGRTILVTGGAGAIGSNLIIVLSSLVMYSSARYIRFS